MIGLAVGQKYREFMIPEGASLAHTETGFQIVITMPKITKKEAKILNDSRIKLYLTEYQDIAFLVLDYGDLSFDMPFNVNIENEGAFEFVPDGQGYVITILSADNTNGELKSIRFISMTTEFSKKIKSIYEAQEPLSLNEYMDLVSIIQLMKRTDQIINDSVASMTIF